METLLVALSPFIIAMITSGVKRIEAIELSDARKHIIRFIVALFSFAAAVLTALLSGGEVDPMSIETFVNALVTFIAATGVYFLGKKKSADQ